MNNWKKLIKIIYEYKREHFFALIFLILQSITSVCLPFILIKIVDIGIGQKNYFVLFTMSGGYMLLTLCYNIFKGTSDYIYAKIGSKIIVDLRKKVLEHLSKLSGKFYSDMKSGDIYSVVTDDIGVIQEICTNTIFTTVTGVIMSIPIIIYLLFLDYRLFIVSVLLQPLYALVQSKIGTLIANHSNYLRDTFGEYSSALQEYLYSPINIEKNKATHYILTKILNLSKKNAKMIMKINLDFSKGQIFGNLMQNFSNILIVLLGGILLINQQTSIGIILVYMQYSGKILTPILSLSQLNMKLKKARISVNRIFNFLDEKSDVNYSIGNLNNIINKGEIIFEDVTFSYIQNNYILENISFSIKSGEVTALVGGSGAGKTSIVNLLYRMWDINDGSIFIDGINIKEFDIEYLRKNISIVSQDIVLLNDTIYNNIVLGDTTISFNEVIKATQIANIYDTIMKLENKFDTVIGDRGIRLSGGQKQRLAIAMAIVKNSPIIIFDEATSALDNINELAIHKKIINIFKDKTILIIAHRLSTIESADKICVLDSHRIVEVGKHNDLIKQRGIYYKLYNKELIEKD